MKRRWTGALITLLCCSALTVGLVGCSPQSNDTVSEPVQEEQTDILATNNMEVLGAFIDESYSGSYSDKDIKRLYVFANINASSGTLKVSSAEFELTASLDEASDTVNSMDVIQNDTDGGSALTNVATSYSCTNVITEIYPGSSEKFAIPFNVPSFYLQEGASYSLNNSNGIADGIVFNFSFIQDATDLESIAQTIDNEGYTSAMEAKQDASADVAQDVMNRINGYEYYASVGGLMQKYYFEGNTYLATLAGLENPGTYTVKNGYLACLQDSTGWVTWVPWEYSDKSENGISIDVSETFTEK